MINNNNMFFIGKSNKIMFLKFNNTSIIITRIRYSIFIIANINKITIGFKIIKNAANYTKSLSTYIY